MISEREREKERKRESKEVADKLQTILSSTEISIPVSPPQS